jgi:hypothetical protein
MLETARGTLQNVLVTKLGSWADSPAIKIWELGAPFSHVSITRALFNVIYQWHRTSPINILLDPSPDLPMDKSDTSSPPPASGPHHLHNPWTGVWPSRPPARLPFHVSLSVGINQLTIPEKKQKNFHPPPDRTDSSKNFCRKLTFYPLPFS